MGGPKAAPCLETASYEEGVQPSPADRRAVEATKSALVYPNETLRCRNAKPGPVKQKPGRRGRAKWGL